MNYIEYAANSILYENTNGNRLALPVQYAYAFVSQGTTSTLVSATSGKKVRLVQICSFEIDSGGTVLQHGRFLSSTGPAQLTPYMRARGFDAGNGVMVDFPLWPFNPAGYLQTASGDALQLQCLAAASGGIGVVIGYIVLSA